MGRRNALAAMLAPSAPGSGKFVEPRTHFTCEIAAHVGIPAHVRSGFGLSWSIRRRISANKARGTATSASWNTT